MRTRAECTQIYLREQAQLAWRCVCKTKTRRRSYSLRCRTHKTYERKHSDVRLWCGADDSQQTLGQWTYIPRLCEHIYVLHIRTRTHSSNESASTLYSGCYVSTFNNYAFMRLCVSGDPKEQPRKSSKPSQKCALYNPAGPAPLTKTTTSIRNPNPIDCGQNAHTHTGTQKWTRTDTNGQCWLAHVARTDLHE